MKWKSKKDVAKSRIKEKLIEDTAADFRKPYCHYSKGSNKTYESVWRLRKASNATR